MTPILYEKDEIDFTSQGLGSLVEIYDVDVAEQRNGLLQFTASYPVSGVRYADISVGRIILSKPNQRDDVHAFRIVSTHLDIGGHSVTIEADSITYDLTHNLVKHLSVSGNGQAFMTALRSEIVNPSIFEFYSDIATSSKTLLNYVNPMEAIMGTTGSFLQIWGGELKRENRRVAMLNRRGRDNVSTFRLGKNIAGLKYNVDISSLVTRIIPTKSIQNDDQTTTTIEGAAVDSKYINNYEQIYTLPLEFTDETIKTVSDLNAAAKGWFTQSANTGRDKPTVTLDIDVLSLQDSADYQDKFKNLESVSLTDTVTVYVPEYGVNVTAIVNELHYDPILDRVTKMTVGTAKKSFADSSRTQLSDLQDKIISVQNQADAAAISANGKNKNYYGSVEPPHSQDGDLWYWINGDKSGIKQFINGEWVDLVSSKIKEQIQNGVEDAISQAKLNAQALVDNNNTVICAEIQKVATQKAQDEIKKGNFDANAQTYANTAKTAAIAQAQSLVSSASTDWSKQLSDAKADYTKKYSEVKTTADGVTESFNSYKLSNDKTLVSYKSLIDKNSQGITLAATKSELNTAKSEFSSQVASVKSDYDKVTTSVSQISGSLNDLLQVNLINNSDFSPDLGGWTTRGTGNFTTGDYDYSGGVYVIESTAGTLARTSSAPIPLNGSSSQVVYSLAFNSYIYKLPSGGRVTSQITFLDANLKETSSIYPGFVELTGNGVGKWIVTKLNGIKFVPPTAAEYIVFSFDARGVGTKAGFNRPILVTGDTVGSYVRGQYSNNDKIALQQITLDSISNIVSNPKTGLSTRIQTAEGFIDQVRGTDIPALQKATFWQPYSSLNFNDYTKQGSFFFNTTAAKTNGPTSSGSWIYLMVEQGTSDNGRIKQTAWYDGVSGVKISYVRTLNSGTWSPWYANDNDSVATISKTNGTIAQEIKDRANGDTNAITQAKSYTTSAINSAVSGLNSTITQTANMLFASIESTNLVINSEFDPLNGTWYQIGTGAPVGTSLGAAWSATQSGSFQDWPVINGSRIINYNNGNWYSTALVVSSAGKVFSASIVAGRSPAPTVSTALDYRIGWWDANRKLIGTSSSGNIIDGTGYKGVEKYVVENKVAPANTKFVSVIIAHSSANANDFISRPSLNYGAKAAPYAPTYGTEQTATVLSLLKSNWSIGIADNIGKIVSGIAANSSQMAIISDKVIIKSPNTQITGTAWIKSAMIANGAIGTTQIGDASITSAKIIALDVSKITGNVSNFIQSNWNGQYSSTTITATGMQIGGVFNDGYRTDFDSTGMSFYQLLDGSITALHFGKSTWKTSTASNAPTVADGAEINWAKGGVGIKYMMFMSPGKNNLEFGSTTSANHVAMAIAPDGIKGDEIPFLNPGVTIFDGLTVNAGIASGSLTTGSIDVRSITNLETLNGANIANFAALKGKKIYIPSGMNSNGSASGWYTIQL